jgi:hypothetical protein
LESPLESRVEISAVVQKTVINAENFTLNCFCLRKVAAVASLVMKLDPAEHASYPNFLTSSLDYLLGDITRKDKKVHRRKHNALLSISLRLILRLPLKRVSRRKFLNAPVERTSCVSGSCWYIYQ